MHSGENPPKNFSDPFQFRTVQVCVLLSIHASLVQVHTCIKNDRLVLEILRYLWLNVEKEAMDDALLLAEKSFY